jgi:membrane protein involved in D-alanine export
MTPYGSTLYFGILLYPALAAIGAGLARRLTWRWVLAATVAMAVVQYWGAVEVGAPRAVRELWIVAAYGAAQWGVMRLFLRRRAAGKSTRAVAMAVGASLAPLAAAKVIPLLAPGTAAGFLGISYITFRALDVLLGIHDGLVKEVPTGRWLAYLFFFPTISSGPIDRWRRFDEDCRRVRTRAEVVADLDAAAHRLVLGFLYKFVLAALVQRFWLGPLEESSGALATVSYMYAYSAFLFLDFAGYSHFAIGASYLFGIHTPENFRRPFLAPNIAEFWNRWHITLSHWFRDQIYMRFVLAAAKGKWFRDKQVASAAGFLVTFGLMGLWHGLAWHYIAYGLYHAALLSAHQWLARSPRTRGWWGESRAWRAAGIVLTANLVCFGFLIFSGRLGG